MFYHWLKLMRPEILVRVEDVIDGILYAETVENLLPIVEADEDLKNACVYSWEEAVENGEPNYNDITVHIEI